jgi:uncharacterized protein with HEPN domain
MVEMCNLLIAHASDDETLATDPVVQAAAQRWIEVLGEAATHISDQLRSAHPEIPWREIIGTRVILAHAYFHVDQDIIGDVVKRDVPAILHDDLLVSLLADGGLTGCLPCHGASSSVVSAQKSDTSLIHPTSRTIS